LVGEENIPDKKAVLFVANHQNALLDPLLIGATNKRIQHFLTQAQVFKNPTVNSILLYINMLPIYRIRDGYDTLTKNEVTFQKCYKILNSKQTLLIFAEGSHSLQRRVRVLTKGFTRIAFGALEQDPSNEIDIIPIGYNYSNAKEFGSSASVYYGKPISANYYWNNFDKNESINQLVDEVGKQLKKLTTHIEDRSNYEQIVQHFKADEFLYPEKVNKTIENLDALPPIPSKSKNSFNPLLLLVKINSVFPLLIWRKVYPKIKEEEYISTFRFTVGITAFPVFYFLQTAIVSFFFGIEIGLIYLFLSILAVFLLNRTKM
jgi:1-acyl-sn-glycerol-3-phosphate acyltransferase